MSMLGVNGVLIGAYQYAASKDVNKAEQEEKRARREKYHELSVEAAEEWKRQMELLYKKQSVMDFPASHSIDMNRIVYTTAPELMSSAVAAYEMNVMT